MINVELVFDAIFVLIWQAFKLTCCNNASALQISLIFATTTDDGLENICNSSPCEFAINTQAKWVSLNRAPWRRHRHQT